MQRRGWFILAVALQIVILLVMIGMKMDTLANGTKILLKTAPVDPWDVFRGDYVILRYDISALRPSEVNFGGERFDSGETVYVTLSREGKYWVARSVSHKKPGGGALFIKGTVEHHSEYDRTLFVSYGIESYYVPQNKGTYLENNRETLDVEVAVDKRGTAALVRLFIKGKEVNLK